MISVTVWAKDAITADAYDNALMGMGVETAMQFLARHRELEAYLIYHDEAGNLRNRATGGFNGMIVNDDAIPR
jgi:thiamine biosynthesis lipoprotein